MQSTTVHSHDPADPDWTEAAVPDDWLWLVFICCHLTLAPEASVALTLRLVCGIATPDSARAFLMSEPAMAVRITRPRRRSPKHGSKPGSGPGGTARASGSVPTAVRLLFSTGRSAGEGDALVRETFETLDHDDWRHLQPLPLV